MIYEYMWFREIVCYSVMGSNSTVAIILELWKLKIGKCYDHRRIEYGVCRRGLW